MDNVRNSDGIWINSLAFREEALHFQKYGYYCSDPYGSKAWYDYWFEQRKRIIEGYETGGARITGDHYFYLNFCPIKKTEDSSKRKSKKVLDFPDFWDGDYNYYWVRDISKNGIADSLRIDEEVKENIFALEEEEKKKQLFTLYESLGLEVKIKDYALEGGYNLIVGKSRRKGYSYKNASLGVKNYLTVPNSTTIFSAYEKKYLYPKGIFNMALNYLNFINENTAWNMPSDYINKMDHRKASYKEYKNGVELERGYKSEMMAVTFKDNADATRGKDALDLIFEESGAFGTPGLLKDCYAASEDCVKDGEIKTGMITIFGTSGDLEGGTADYAEMFTNPERFGLLPLEDVWEDEVEFKGKPQGFFHPAQWNLPGFYDLQGNSDVVSAKNIIIGERAIRAEKGANTTDIAKLSQEKPVKAREAFAYSSHNIFPTQELQRQRDILKFKGWDVLKGQPVNMFKDPETGKVTVEADMQGKLEPIREYHYTSNPSSAPVIYEMPIPNSQRGAYKIGYDPVRQDTGTSLSAIVVFKSFIRGSYTRDCIVAEYVGRTDTPDDAHYIAEMFAELYNTQVMYENEVPDVKTYFLRRKKLHLLALQPNAVISKNVKHSTVNRVYGCHMNLQLKDAAEKYTKEWMKQINDYDENEAPISTISNIYSPRFLDEAILYNRKENFDLMSAFFMCIIQVQEEVIGKEYHETVANRNASKLLEQMKTRMNQNSLTSRIR